MHRRPEVQGSFIYLYIIKDLPALRILGKGF
jgi:hypothetical protein